MLIRPMEPQDISQVADIESKSFSMPWSEEGFLDALGYDDNILLVATEAEKIVGYVCVYVSFDEGELTNIAVEPDCRGQGIGFELMDAVKTEAMNSSVSRIVLEVRVSNNPAITLYEKCGFTNIGIRKNFYEQPREDAYIMVYSAEDI